MSEDKYKLALEILGKIHAKTGGEEVSGTLKDLSPSFAKAGITFGFGEIYGDPIFDLRHREIMTVAILTALDRERELKLHIGSALNVGLTPKEIVAIIAHASVLAGMPVALSGLILAKEVFDSRGVSVE